MIEVFYRLSTFTAYVQDTVDNIRRELPADNPAYLYLKERLNHAPCFGIEFIESAGSWRMFGTRMHVSVEPEAIIESDRQAISELCAFLYQDDENRMHPELAGITDKKRAAHREQWEKWYKRNQK